MICIRGVIVAFAFFVSIPSAVLADADTLLSRNAAYRIIGESYLYAGQNLPGTNIKVGNAEGFQRTPLVELTDTGSVLIDGDRKTTVYTPWSWRKNCKRITVEMLLPGPSTISKVIVRLPEEPAMRPQDITLEVKEAEGEWKQIEVIQTGPAAALAPPETRKDHQEFVLSKVKCQEIRVVCVDQGVMTAQCGIAEIEVYGDGPTENSNRGLIRSEPHIRSITPSDPIRPAGSRKLTKEGSTRVELSGTPLTSGNGTMLVDGDPSTTVRIDHERSANSQLVVELDLGDVYLIDSINIWMPGGKGVESGHINDLNLAITASSDAFGWQIPSDLIVNPYWPEDDAPAPYVIPMGDLDTVGQRIRIIATLSGESGVTLRLAMSDIEVWGRKVDASHSRQASARLAPKPIRFDPEPVKMIHPKLKWLTDQKVRGIWAGEELREKFERTEKTKGEVVADAGFNLYFNIMAPFKENRSISHDIENHLTANIAEAQRLGIHYMVVWQYGSNHEEPYPRYRGPDGNIAEKSCCPLNEEYFERHIARWAIAIASAGAEGMVIDTEMYESDQTRYPGPCLCDDCFIAYLKAFSNDWNALYDQVKPARRGIWLTNNQAMEHYRDYSLQRTEQLYDKLRQRCQVINSAFLFGHAPGLEYLPGIERGLGTSVVPCLIFSEREYTNGVDDVTLTNMKNVRENMPAFYLPGLYLVYQTTEMIEQNGLLASLYADGWWLYYGWAILNYPGTEDSRAYDAGYGRVKGTTAQRYLDAIREMHQQAEKLLTQPKNQWPTCKVPANR